MKKILIIDDDPVFLTLTSNYLSKHSLKCETCQSWHEAKAFLAKHSWVDLALVDLFLGGISGIKLIHKIKEINPLIPILMITAHSSIQTAIEAVQAGAEDYIQKPCENSEILFKIQRVFEKVKQSSELENLRQTLSHELSFRDMLTFDEETQKVYQLAQTVANMDVIISIGGETGTGKEVLAKAIHLERGTRNKPFMVFNCASLNENLIESELFGHQKGSFTSAHADKKGLCEKVGKGTLFIDEIGELSLSVQKKFLRLLQEKEFERIGSSKVRKFEGRVIIATHRDLKQMVQEGSFRDDLFFRLNVYPLHLKPLRERKADIMDLAHLFLMRYAKKFEKKASGFSPESKELMLAYSWPGNIRELEHFVERQTLLSEDSFIACHPRDFPEELSNTSGSLRSPLFSPQKEYSHFIKEQEKDYFIALLKKHQGSIERSAQAANIHRKTLYMKLKEFQLNRNDYKTSE